MLILLLSAAAIAERPSAKPEFKPAGDSGRGGVAAKRRTDSRRWRRYPVRLLADLPGLEARPGKIARTTYGGRADRRVKPTGYFHTRRIDGRWWFVDPRGGLWYAMGICTVRMNFTDAGKAALSKRFGTREAWAQQTCALLREHGFNVLGAWSQVSRLRAAPNRMPYARITNFAAEYAKRRRGVETGCGHYEYPNDCIPVFDAEFEKFCRMLARRRLGVAHDDPWMVGYFSDNELPFHRDMLPRYLSLPPQDPGRAAAEAWCRERKLNPDATARFSEADRADFLRHVAETYFRKVKAAARTVDKNHMFLGCRFHGPALRYPELFGACAKYVDVVSVNYYGAWSPNRERMATWARESQRPFMISEFYAKGADSGLPNTSGAGFLVKTQADRGRFYQSFALDLLEEPNCVGWQWFRYMDNDPSNDWADASNRDSNKGVVSASYVPWSPLLDRMKAIHERSYQLIDYFDRRRPADR